MVAIMVAVVVVVEVEVEVAVAGTVSRVGSDIVKRKNNHHQASVLAIGIRYRQATIVEAGFTVIVFPIWTDSIEILLSGNLQGGNGLERSLNHTCGLIPSQLELGMASIY